MLPARAYADVPQFSPGSSNVHGRVDARDAFVIAAAPADIAQFPTGDFVPYRAETTGEAMRLIETARPRVVAIDWDVPEIDGRQVCTAARKFAHTAVLVTMSQSADAPSALNAGCHAILLKPVARNLIAARLGRLAREVPTEPVGGRLRTAIPQYGTNRVWPDTHCVQCNAPAPTSFEFASYRRMWYACLACDAVWLGPRRE